MSTVDFSTVPVEMRSLPNWLCWKSEIVNGKATKIPYRADGAGRASSTDPTTWTTFDQAVSVADKFSGIGFAVTEESKIVLVDLDHCIVDGELLSWAAEIVGVANTYTEISPSGKGLHLFFSGKLPGRGRKAGDAETYNTGRYFTVTGKTDPRSAAFRRLSDEESSRVYALIVARGKSAPEVASVAGSVRVDPPSRHEFLIKLGASAAHHGASPAAIHALLTAQNAAFVEPKGAAEVQRAFEWCATHRPGEPMPTEAVDPSSVYTFSWADNPPEEPALLTFCGKEILGPEGIAILTGPQGKGKTQIVNAIAASCLNPLCDSLSFKANTPMMLVVDTENPLKNFRRNVRRCAINRAGLSENTPLCVEWVSIRGIDDWEQRQEWFFEKISQPDTPKLVLLDGAGDMVLDVNDVPSAVSFVSKACAITLRNRIGLFVTLHGNPMQFNEKARGHLGSELIRKADCSLLLRVDKDTRCITSEHTCGKNRSDQDNLTQFFQWSDELSMHVSCKSPAIEGSTGAVTKGREKIVLAMGNRCYSYSELVCLIMEVGKSEGTAKRWVKELLGLKRVQKLENGTYLVAEKPKVEPEIKDWTDK